MSCTYMGKFEENLIIKFVFFWTKILTDGLYYTSIPCSIIKFYSAYKFSYWEIQLNAISNIFFFFIQWHADTKKYKILSTKSIIFFFISIYLLYQTYHNFAYLVHFQINKMKLRFYPRTALKVIKEHFLITSILFGSCM